MRSQLLHQSASRRIRKVSHDTVRDRGADAAHVEYVVRRGGDDGIQGSEVLGQKLRRNRADVPDSERVQET